MRFCRIRAKDGLSLDPLQQPPHITPTLPWYKWFIDLLSHWIEQ